MDMMDNEDTMQGETGMDENKPGMGEPGDSEEQVSIFAPKASLEGLKVKPGDEVIFKVKDMDPETGDVELVYARDEHGEGDEHMGESMGDQFDKAMDEKGY